MYLYWDVYQNKSPSSFPPLIEYVPELHGYKLVVLGRVRIRFEYKLTGMENFNSNPTRLIKFVMYVNPFN